MTDQPQPPEPRMHPLIPLTLGFLCTSMFFITVAVRAIARDLHAIAQHLTSQ